MGLADVHIHTIYSYDGTASVPAVLARAKHVGLNVIAITDHDEIKGALKAFDLGWVPLVCWGPGRSTISSARRPG